MPYSFDSRIRYSEVDKDRKITLNAILDYFQDCSCFHSEDLGVGMTYLQENHVAWVLNSWKIEVMKYAFHGEKIRVSTWPYDFRGFLGYRNFIMESESGELLARANTVWTLLDSETMRPTRLLPVITEAYQMSEKIEMEEPPRKMKLPEGMEEREPFRVQKHHIDTNHHVNNGKYVGMAQEYLPEQFEVGAMRAEYKKAAVYGDMICPFVKIEEHKVTVNLADLEGTPYAIVELEEKE